MGNKCEYINSDDCPVVKGVSSIKATSGDGLSLGALRELVCKAEIDDEVREKDCPKFRELKIK